MKLTFWGAAQVVTGSMHQLADRRQCYLLDCGEYQGRRKEAEERNRDFPFPCKDVSAVMLSHAHIDHSGNLPLLVKNGFHGPIYTSPATADLCGPMLRDAASLQEHDAAFLNKRNLRRKSLQLPGVPIDEPVAPLYTAGTPRPLFRSSPRGAAYADRRSAPGWSINPSKPATSLDPPRCCWNLNRTERKCAWASGETWAARPAHHSGSGAAAAGRYLILESTYGNRVHEPIQSVSAKLAEIVNRTYRRGGKLIVPAFAVGRTQQLVLMLHELIDANAIPNSRSSSTARCAVNVTDVFRKHPELYDDETREFLNNHGDPFGFKLLTYVRDVEPIQGAERSARALHGDFRIRDVRRAAACCIT